MSNVVNCSTPNDDQLPLHLRFDPQRVFSVQAIAELSGLSDHFIRRLFSKERGVLVIKNPRKGYRDYRTLRIPGWVARDVFRRLTNGDHP
jgi:hypothetical protein